MLAQPEIDNIQKFWRHLHGGQRDLLQIFTAKRNSDGTIDRATIKSKFFVYPKEAEAAAKWALEKSEERREVYQCAHLLTEERRVKENAAAVHCLWGELDGTEVPNGELKPTAVVESSPGHYHVYWRLTDAIPADIAEQLNKRLAHKIGADPSGFDRTQLLRVPYTTNYKYEGRPVVELLALDGERDYPVGDLDRILPLIPEADGHNKASEEGPRTTPPMTDAEVLRQAESAKNGLNFAEVYRGRGDFKSDSERDMSLASRLAFWTQDEEQIERIMRGSGCVREKWDEHRTYLRDTIRKAIGSLTEPYHPGGRQAKAEPTRDSEASASAGDKPTDDELRDRFIERRPEYAYGLGRWRHYGVGVWEATDELGVRDEVCHILEEAKKEKIRPNRALVLSVSELAKARVAVADEKWDADPDILVCANGALRLSTRELEPHSRDHYATARVPYDYAPDAVPEVWEQRVMGELIAQNLGVETVDFIQEFAGYALTPDTSHEIALWFTGKHGGGRSTILAGLGAMLGPRAGILSLSDLDRSGFALTNLPGKTLVTATEQPSTFLRGGGVLNAIISGEPIQIDLKFRDPIEITPRCKIAWAMNELPRVGSPDDGLFRRVRVLSIPEIPEEDRDPAVKEEVKASGAAILNWALDGLDRLHERGRFTTPEKVRTATDEFKEDNDVVALFIEEKCDVGLEYWESSSLLYDEYKEWSIENGHKPHSSTSIAREWRRLGFEKKRHMNGVRWLGLKVRSKANSAFFGDVNGDM
jgi:P4 family phage/plasmid primase-like protien